MLSLILLITFNDRGNFNPSFFTKAYKNNLNSDKTQFKCMNSDKYINLNQINDGICDCCDGSDEALNPHVHCEDVCGAIRRRSVFFRKNLTNMTVEGGKIRQKYSERGRLELSSRRKQLQSVE